MVTRTAPSAWRAISPVSSVTWWRPNWNVFLMDFTMSSCSWRSLHRRRGLGKRAPPKTTNPARARSRPRGVFVGLWRPLLAQAEALDDRAVRLDFAALEVIQQAATLAHELEQAPAGMEIL